MNDKPNFEADAFRDYDEAPHPLGKIKPDEPMWHMFAGLEIGPITCVTVVVDREGIFWRVDPGSGTITRVVKR